MFNSWMNQTRRPWNPTTQFGKSTKDLEHSERRPVIPSLNVECMHLVDHSQGKDML
jgi:hypothetical protein